VQETEGGHLQVLPDMNRTASDAVVDSGHCIHCNSSARKASLSLSFFEDWKSSREDAK